METHQQPPPSASLLYTVATRSGEAFLQGGGVTLQSLETGETCDNFSLNVNIRKNSHTASYTLLQLRLCQACNFTGHNYTCPLLWFGAVPNSNMQLILHTCWLPTCQHPVCSPKKSQQLNTPHQVSVPQNHSGAQWMEVLPSVAALPRLQVWLSHHGKEIMVTRITGTILTWPCVTH
jgi:hypothetical protein